MNVYIRNQVGDALIEKGQILACGGTKREYLMTGNDEIMMISLGKFATRKRAQEILNEIMQRVVEPTAKEVQKGIIFIDLKGIE